MFPLINPVFLIVPTAQLKTQTLIFCFQTSAYSFENPNTFERSLICNELAYCTKAIAPFPI